MRMQPAAKQERRDKYVTRFFCLLNEKTFHSRYPGHQKYATIIECVWVCGNCKQQ